jgi:hypothetical protein
VYRMLQLSERLSSRPHRLDAYQCVLRFPDSTETRWFKKLPTRGMRIRSQGWAFYRGRLWVVEEVLQSGRDTYTVFCVDRRQYLDNLRHGSADKSDLAAELLEVARHTASAVTEQGRRWKRQYLP